MNFLLKNIRTTKNLFELYNPKSMKFNDFKEIDFIWF